MLEKNYKLAEMIFLEQVMGEERPDGKRDHRGKKNKQTQGEERALVSWASKDLGRTFRNGYTINFAQVLPLHYSLQLLFLS